ncbi:c-type heme family protein [Pseudodesulfovibrio karagichevae]|uniref:histidine kinase n=1 Tax=Pseudodesulfovibrio karagichevae TaxID=3239305 RepID=A0ABV4JZP2_9BACT
MRRLMPHSLQSKFFTGLFLLMTGLVAFFAVGLNIHLNRLMEGEAREKASLILAQVEAVQRYVRNTLRPVMYKTLPSDHFVLEAMSASYVTRAVMSDPNLEHNSFTYRRVTEGARNPDSEANALEREFIDRFRADPELKHLEEFRDADGERYFITVYAQRYDVSCMHCHGEPDEAPHELIERYGDVRGFGNHVGGLAGIDMVRLKVERDVGGIRDATLSFALLFALGILVQFLIIQGFFHRLVVHSLGRVTGVMQRLFPDEAPLQTEPFLPQEDEIEGLLHGFELFAEHLRQARVDLKEYAATLEDKVAERTVDLTRLADDRRADVALFVSLLNSLNQSQTKQELLLAGLELIARRFGASSASYVCVLAATDFASWPDPDVPPELPEDWHDLVTGVEPRMGDLSWHIPVQTSGTSRGLLNLYWDQPQERSDRLVDLARAIGQQLGIAMENMEALDGLLTQNAMLSSLFEGTADPLMLLDAGDAVLLANSTAVRLADTLDEPGVASLLKMVHEATRDTGCGEFELQDGRIFVAHLYPLKETKGRRTVASLREVTMERRMEDQMVRNERMVAVGQLAAGLAHEINNPLGVILCYAELLAASQKNGQAQADLAVIIRHTELAQRVVRDLLDFSRPRPASLEPGDLAAVAAATVDLLQPRAKSCGAELLLEAATEIPPLGAGTDALEHILTNLIMNALDAVNGLEEKGRTGEVRVIISAGGRFAEITVADNGTGILPEHLNRVFDPFFSTKEAGKGTGLGLSVIYSLIRDLGGDIEVENRPGGGALFRVFLPLAAKDDEEAE